MSKLPQRKLLLIEKLLTNEATPKYKTWKPREIERVRSQRVLLSLSSPTQCSRWSIERESAEAVFARVLAPDRALLGRRELRRDRVRLHVAQADEADRWTRRCHAAVHLLPVQRARAQQVRQVAVQVAADERCGSHMRVMWDIDLEWVMARGVTGKEKWRIGKFLVLYTSNLVKWHTWKPNPSGALHRKDWAQFHWKKIESTYYCTLDRKN